MTTSSSNKLNLSNSNIVSRIYATLPPFFTREGGTVLEALIKGVAEIFAINSNQIDNLFDRTGISSATGAFLDNHINDLSKIGRNDGESDDDYRDRYFTYIFEYNGTNDGIKTIVYDQLGYYPTLQVDKQTFSFYNAGYFYNDELSKYKNANGVPYTLFVVLEEQPTEDGIDILCNLINENRVAGVDTYLKWPSEAVYDGSYYDESFYG